MDLSCLWKMVLLVTPTEVELSVWMGVLGWGHPTSMRVCRIGTIALAVMKRPASSYSAAEDMTNLMIWAMVIMDPLSQRMGSPLDIKIWDPARLLAL